MPVLSSPLRPARVPDPWSAHFAAALKLGLPLAATQLAQIAIGTTDTIMIGWLGAKELAASVLGAQTFFVVLMLGSGLALAIMPLASQAEGRGDTRGVRRSLRMGLWALAIYATVMMLPLWYAREGLILLGQDEEVATLAGGYLQIMQWSLFPALFIMALRSFMSALRRPQVVLIATVGAVFVNGFLNYMLIFGNFGAPALRLEGAAIASLVTTVLTFGLLLVYTLWDRAFRSYEIYRRIWVADWPAFFELNRLGWPISLMVIAEVGMFVASSIMIGWIGTIELAAHGIALQLASIAFMIPLGLSSAATVLVGQAAGRGDAPNMRRAAHAVLIVATIIAVLAGVLFFAIPGQLIGLFLEETNPDALAVAAYAVPLLAVAAAFQLADALQAIGGGLLRGLKDTKIPMLMAIFSYWGIGLTCAYVLGFSAGLGAIGVWSGLALGLLIAAVLLNWRFAARQNTLLQPPTGTIVTGGT